jgi:hypothetical protein
MEVGGPVGGVERAAADCALHDHGPRREPRDDPASCQESSPGGRSSGRGLGDDHAALRDGLEQLRVRGRIGAIDSAGHHGDGGAAGGQNSAMGGLVDAEREAADDGLTHGGQLSAQVARLLHAVAGRSS